MLRSAPGVAWLVPYVEGIVISDEADDQAPEPTLAAVVVDDAGPARSVADSLERGGSVRRHTASTPWGLLHRLTASEWASACTSVYDMIVAGQLRHRGQPVLDEAVTAAARRPLGDGSWAWSRRKSAGPVCALTAATAAVAGLLAEPVREPAIGAAETQNGP